MNGWLPKHTSFADKRHEFVTVVILDDVILTVSHISQYFALIAPRDAQDPGFRLPRVADSNLPRSEGEKKEKEIERERERERDRQTHTQRQRKTETKKKRDTETQRLNNKNRQTVN